MVRSRVRTAFAAVVALAVGVTAGCSSRLPNICGRHRAGSESVAFSTPDEGAIQRHLPEFGHAPEIEGAGPLVVVIFEGPHQGIALHPGLRQGELRQGDQELPANVVCVATARGEEHYYTDVDVAGLDLDGLILDRVGP